MAAQRKHGHGVVPKQSRSDESIRITTTTTTNYYNNNNNPVKQTIAPAPASPSFSPSSDGTAWSIHVDRDIRPMDPTKRSRQAKLDAVAFFLSGIVNNVVYVVFLSAAADMLQGTQGVPKSVVLLADVLPSVLVKLTAPYVMHLVSYHTRIVACVVLSILSLQINAWVDHVGLKLFGVILCSAGTGLGEITYLALCSFYQDATLTAWSSGTGMAGVVGAMGYVLLTSLLALETYQTMCVLSVLPLCQWLAFACLLSKPYQAVERRRLAPAAGRAGVSFQVLSSTMSQETAGGMGRTPTPPIDAAVASGPSDEHASPGEPIEFNKGLSGRRPEDKTFKEKLQILKTLALPYILPLFLVYYAEYTINFGMFHGLLFPPEGRFFDKLEDHYRYYQAMYQIGVFISRTSIGWIQINVWYPSLLQVFNFVLFFLESVYQFIPNVYIVLALILFEGLMGGAAYANAFYQIRRNVAPANVEFAMGVVTVADSIGIAFAGVTGLFLEPFLCAFNHLCSN